MIDAMAKAHYRARQFFASLRPNISEADRLLVKSVFGQNEQALALFESMNIADRQHALAVLRTLRRKGQTDVALQQAALLHDVGKAMGQPLLHRVIIVLLKAFWPAALTKLAEAPLTCAFWRRPFVVNALHPQLGATWAEEAGCDDLVVSLIRIHQDRPAQAAQVGLEKLHKALYEADSTN